MSTIRTIEPVRKTAVVPCERDEAFDIFTARMQDWWPLATHSVAGNHAVSVVVTPPAVGGQIIESAADGRTFVWGTITEWSPGKKVAFTWHPGHDADEATLVEVSFAAAPAGGCAVELVHSGWERRTDGVDMRASYVPGWDVVLAPYLTLAAAR